MFYSFFYQKCPKIWGMGYFFVAECRFSYIFNIIHILFFIEIAENIFLFNIIYDKLYTMHTIEFKRSKKGICRFKMQFFYRKLQFYIKQKNPE